MPQSYEPLKVEDWVFEYWRKNSIYKKVVELRKKGPKYYFLDGPPYVTNPIHVGTAWNKIIKDAILRYQRMRGYDVWDKPGYDMHGLPIEVQVEKQLGFKTKKDILKYGVENFIRVCREWALKNLKVQERQFRELGVWMDWENPYRTIDNEYIEATWLFLKKAEEKGLLYYGKKVVHWCPRCETVLAGHEVAQEYRDVSDPSIYVKFPLEGREESLLIWTTTPWTLPSNVAVMVHPNEAYVRARTEDGEIIIVAEKRVEAVERETGKRLEVLDRFMGMDLEGFVYRNPLEEYVPLQKNIVHQVVLSEEFVTMEEGTGLVHSAPGHGEEDFEVGVKYGLPMPSPVDDSGRFTEEAGKYAGLNVFEANKVIIEDLRRLGALYYEGRIVHKYPHCWRCKSKLILRLSEQWFVRMSDLREELVKEAENTMWTPEWALERRFIPWLSNAKDWAISRQRYWGIPLPIWICEEGHRTVVGSFEELRRLAIEMPAGEVDLHKPWIDGVVIRCPKCGKPAKRVPDVLDVWVDSGVASWASLGYPRSDEVFKELWPADLILEGPDQIRGWFYSLIATSYVTFGKAPYKRVLMHGWSLDEKGRAMHKSLGNVVYPEDVIPHYGRDALRVFELSNTTWENLKFSIKVLRSYFRNLSIIWNVYYFASLYMNLDGYDPSKYTPETLSKHLRSEDRWLLSRLQSIIKRATEEMERLHIFNALKLILNFLIEDVSRWYVKLIRRRVWVEPNDPDKLAAYSVLYRVLDASLRMLAPFAPFITEYIYVHMFKEHRQFESIHMLEWPEPEEKWVDRKLEEKMEIVKRIVEAASAARQQRGVKLRRPVRRVIISTESKEVVEAVKTYEPLLKDQVNAKEVVIMRPVEVEAIAFEPLVELNYSVAGPVFKSRVGGIAEALSRLDPKIVIEELERSGGVKLSVDGEEVTVSASMVNVKKVLKKHYSAKEFPMGHIYIDLTPTKELEAEALARELVRRIQFMRKELALNIDEYIDVEIVVPSEEAKELALSQLNYVSGEVRGREVKLTFKPEMEGYRRQWDIDGETYIITVKRLSPS